MQKNVQIILARFSEYKKVNTSMSNHKVQGKKCYRHPKISLCAPSQSLSLFSSPNTIIL